MVVTSDSDATVMLLCMPSVCNVHIADGTRLFSNFNVSSWVMDNWQLTCGEFGVCSEAASDIETAPRKRDHGMGRGRLAGTPPGSGGAAEVAPAVLLGARARGLLLAAPWPAGLPALPRMLRLRALPGAARCRAVALSDAAAEPAAAAQQQHDRPAQADPSKGKQAKPQGNKAKKAPGGGGSAKAKSAHGRKQVQARKRKAGPESKRKQANAGTKAQAASKTTGKPTKATSERAGRGPGIVSGLRRLDLAGAKRNMLKNFQSNAYAGQKQLFNAVRRVRGLTLLAAEAPLHQALARSARGDRVPHAHSGLRKPGRAAGCCRRGGRYRTVCAGKLGMRLWCACRIIAAIYCGGRVRRAICA